MACGHMHCPNSSRTLTKSVCRKSLIYISCNLYSLTFLFYIFKTKLPKHVLENLHLLSDFCTVDYPMPDNPKRAILYRRSSSTGGGGGGEDENCNRRNSVISEEEVRVRQELGRRLSNHTVPALQIPKEEYPSVLVVEATNTNAVVLR